MYPLMHPSEIRGDAFVATTTHPVASLIRRQNILPIITQRRALAQLNFQVIITPSSVKSDLRVGGKMELDVGLRQVDRNRLLSMIQSRQRSLGKPER